MGDGQYSLWWNWVKSAFPQLPGPWIKCSLRLILCFKILCSVSLIHSCWAFSSWLNSSLPTSQSTEACSVLVWVEVEGGSASVWLTLLYAHCNVQRLLKSQQQKTQGRTLPSQPPIIFLPWETAHGKSSFFHSEKQKKDMEKNWGGKKKNNIGKYLKLLSCCACYATSCIRVCI